MSWNFWRPRCAVMSGTCSSFLSHTGRRSCRGARRDPCGFDAARSRPGSRSARYLRPQLPAPLGVHSGVEWRFDEQGIVAMAPQPDLVVAHRKALELTHAPALAVEILVTLRRQPAGEVTRLPDRGKAARLCGSRPAGLPGGGSLRPGADPDPLRTAGRRPDGG